MKKKPKGTPDTPLGRLIEFGAASDDPDVAKWFRAFQQPEKSGRRKPKVGKPRAKTTKRPTGAAPADRSRGSA